MCGILKIKSEKTEYSKQPDTKKGFIYVIVDRAVYFLGLNYFVRLLLGASNQLGII